MALETIRNYAVIGGFKVNHEPDGDHPGFFPIIIDHKKNIISFKIQSGPIKENGVNGCQVDTLIHASREIIHKLNKKFPCDENTLALAALDIAICELNKRKKDREQRGVEGTSQS